MTQSTEMRPEDDFESFMAMMGTSPSDNGETEVHAEVADTDTEVDTDEDNVTEEYDEMSALRNVMESGNNEDETDDEEDFEDEDEYEEGEEAPEESAYDVDFDTVITLPNGDEISIEDLHQGYLSGDDLKEREEELTTRQTDYTNKFKDIDKLLDTAKLEADRVLEDFNGFDWQKLASENPQEFANTKLFVEKYVARSKEIKEAQSQRAESLETEKAEAVAVKAKACVDILKADIPEWNSELYGEILQHAVENLGMDADSAKNLVDPSMIKAIHRSLQLDKGTVKARATLKRVGSPKKVAKAGAKRTAKVKNSAGANYNSEVGEFDFFRNSLI